jgi:Ca2+:H+ antiporter
VVLAFFVTSITLVAGRTHLMLGLVHLVLFGAFLFLSLVP